MLNFKLVCESIKRYWIAILAITVVCVGVGVASSLMNRSDDVTKPEYTAEATLYVKIYGYGEDEREGGDYNYQQSETLAVNDVTRLVTSSKVAGVLREKYGEDVTITTQLWTDSETKSTFSNRYVYIDATAEDPELAKQVANEAAQMTIDAAEGVVPLDSLTIATEAALRQEGKGAAEWGSSAFVDTEEQAPVVSMVSSLNKKTLVIYGLLGLCGSLVVFLAYDVLTRRVRSASDVERLLDIPVIDAVSASGDMTAAGIAVRALMKRNGLNSAIVVGASEADGAQVALNNIEPVMEGYTLSSTEFADDVDAVAKVLDFDAVLVVLKQGASKGGQLDHMMKQLKIAGVPVLGCLFVTKK